MSLDGEARLLLVAPAEAGTAGNVAQGRRWPPSSRGRRSLRRVLVRPPRAPALLYHGARRAAAVVAPAGFAPAIASSEARRVGQKCVRTCRLRWAPSH